MVSRRARATTNLGTRIGALQEGLTSLEGRTRTPADDGSEARLAEVERKLELLSSVNYRLEEEANAQNTGWTAVAVAGGFAEQTGEGPEVRRIGNQVYIRGGWNSTGIAASTTYAAIGTIPEGFRPVRTVYFSPGMATGAANSTMRIEPNGDVGLRTGGTASTYYMPSISWLTD